MPYQNLLVSSENQVTTIVINRPDQLNALNKSTIAELSKAFSTAENDPGIKAIIIIGSGEKAFVAGADIKEFYQFTIEEGKALAADGQKNLFDLIANLNTPVIAAVNGFALGGGLELAMSAHMRVASENAKMGLPEVSLGVIPGYGGTQRLAQLAGKGKAFEMITTAAMVDANEALQCGLVNHVVPAEELMLKCQDLAKRISRNSSVAISGAIKAINAGYENGVNGYKAEIDEFGKCFGTEDFKEGTSAFVEKRRPAFPGK